MYIPGRFSVNMTDGGVRRTFEQNVRRGSPADVPVLSYP